MGFESYAASKEGILSSKRNRGGQRNFQTVEQGPMKNNGQESFSQEADLGFILEAFFTPRVGFSGSLPIKI